MTFSAIIIVLLCLLLVTSCYYMLKFALNLIEIEDRLNRSISNIEKSYEVFDNISKKPIFFDSVEIRQCVQEIVNTREVLYQITEDLSEVSGREVKLENKGYNETKRKEENN